MKKTLMIVEDDYGFAGLLSSIFVLSKDFAVSEVFHSIGDFETAFREADLSQRWLPDLVVADFVNREKPLHDSLSVLLKIRSEGYKFGILLISGLPLGAAQKIARKHAISNFEVLEKSSHLKPEEIISAAMKSLGRDIDEGGGR